MHSYCLGDFYLLGYIKAVFVTARYGFDSSGIKWRVWENPDFQGGEMHHRSEGVCFLSLICVWAEWKQHLGWLLMGSCKGMWNKTLIVGPVMSFLPWSTLRGWAKKRWLQVTERCRSPVCVTSREELKLSQQQQGLAQSQAAAACGGGFGWKPWNIGLREEHRVCLILAKVPTFPEALFHSSASSGEQAGTQVSVKNERWWG